MLTDYFYVQLRQSVKVALPLLSTAEVISLRRGDICPIPGVAPALLGVVNHRGKILWVLELSDLLKLAPSPGLARPQDRLTLVVLRASNDGVGEGAERQIACAVSALSGIVPLNPRQFKPVSKKLTSELRPFVSGVTEIEQSRVAILNIEAILAALSASVPTTSLIRQ